MQTLHQWCKTHQGIADYSEPLIIQDQISSDVYPGPGVMLWNPMGRGILRTVDVHTQRVWNNLELVDKFVMLQDVPLAYWRAVSCDTCTRIIQAGFENAEEVTYHVQLIRSLTKEVLQQPAAIWIDKLMGIIELLPAGFYYLTLLDYYPTDGNGNFFWDAFDALRCWRALSLGREPTEEFPDPYQSRPPCYLAPSQAPICFSNESMERAKAHYSTHPGLALKLHEQGSLLLDGHHRATAAALNGTPFTCLTIIPCGRYRIMGSGVEVTVSIPKLFRKWLHERDVQENSYLSTEEYLQKQKNTYAWREDVLDSISKSAYQWTLPETLNLQQAVQHFPVIYKQDRAELAKAMEGYNRLLYPEHIKYSATRANQGEFL